MSKRRPSSLSPPPAKRFHRHEDEDDTSKHQKHLRTVSPSFHNSLYDELILCIFSHLSWVDLCAAQATSRKWSRLATDNELWRNLYLKTFGRPRLRGVRGFVGRNGRDCKPLLAQADGDEVRNWKWMFRISSNWRKGRCAVERFHAPPLEEAAQPSHQTHILLTGPLVISAPSQPSTSPWICLSGGELCHMLHCSTNEPGLYHITALAQDQSRPTSEHARIAAFLHNGEVFIFHVDHSDPTSSHLQMRHVLARRSSRTSPISQAVYHHPILITLSDSFNLSIYDLSSGSARHSQTLTSYSSYPPTSLTLSAPTPEAYKLVLTYSVPVYPRHWSVGVTELVISSSQCDANSSTCTPSFLSQRSVSPMSVTSTRTIRAVDIPQGWIDEDKLRTVQEQWSRKVAQVTDTQSDGKWVIMAPADPELPAMLPSSGAPHSCSSTSLQLYRLSLPPLSPSVSTPRPKLNFVRNLHGHTSPVSSLAVADGRCVSLGIDGSIWVWDLETGAATQVSGLSSELEAVSDTQLIKGTAVFDERRIITARGNDVMIRRFDV